MEGYSPQEADFQFGIRSTPWFSEFAQQHGEPNLNDPNYDYRAAWTAGARPNVRDPGDNQLHWSSQFKGPEHPNRFVNGVDTITGQPVSTGEEYAGLGGDPSHLATTIKNWWTNQPSWLDRARTENQKTSEAFQRGGMGEIAKQLATDTTEAQDLAGSFGVGNIKGVRPPLAPGALAATSEYRPPFYSAVEQAVQGAKQNAAPGQQWAGFLRNQPGVKQEEVQALGLGKLFEQPSVSKEAVLGEIAANRVNVGEVVKGSPVNMSSKYALPEVLAVQRQTAGTADDLALTLANDSRAYNAIMKRHPELIENDDWAHIVAQDVFGSPTSQTKFSQYTLPGGENYREMLLTLPKKPKDIGPAPELLTELPKGPDWDNSYRVIRYRGDGPEREWGVIPPGQSHARAMAGQHPTEAEAVRQALNHINAQNAQQYNQALHDANKSGQFTSSHFDEPNVLAHVRYNDRVIDGKKTLFVEEVQCDWHQKGKREGYAQEPDTSGWKATPSSTEPQPLDNRAPGGWWNVYDQGGNRVGTTPRHSATTPEAAIADVAGREKFKGVPDAPFKTTWPELAMKRIIREAAEKGYDKVAWTPGSVQAARYDLSKHVDGIRWEPTISTPDQRVVRIDPRDGKTINLQIDKNGTVVSSFPRSGGNQFEGRHLSDVVGKDIAEKIISGKEAGFLKDLDLQVGGEGMKGFYDEILPATVNRLVKKHGGRVKQGEIYGSRSKNRTEYRDFQEYADMRYKEKEGKLPKHSVHTLDITPSLRAAAMKGFPLFTAGGVAATGVISDLARQDEYR